LKKEWCRRIGKARTIMERLNKNGALALKGIGEKNL
jgi:hypothetical protein